MTLSRREDDHIATMFPAPAAPRTAQLPCRRLTETATLPSYQRQGDAGADLYSDEDVDVYASTVRRIRTGCAFKIPDGYVGLCCSRSGLAEKHKLCVFNAPGIIDSNYTGPADVLLANFGSSTYRVRRGDRIAQLVIVPVVQGVFVEVAALPTTDRGALGFGSSGISKQVGCAQRGHVVKSQLDPTCIHCGCAI